MIVSVLSNIGILTTAALVMFLMLRRFGLVLGSLRANVMLGLVFGLIAATVIHIPIETPIGARFDTRAGPTIMAGFFGGPVAAVIASVFSGTARYIVGGPWIWAGIVGPAIGSAIGVLAGHLHGRTSRPPSLRYLLGLAAIATVAALPTPFIGMPFDVAFRALSDYWWLLALSITVGVVVIGLVYGELIRFRAEAEGHREAATALDQALRSAQMGRWRIDLGNDALVWDARQMELFGIDPADFNGRLDTFFAAIHPNDVAQVRADFEALVTAGERYTSSFRIVRPDGSVRHLGASSELVRDAAGRAIGAQGMNWDITDQVETETAGARHKLWLEQIVFHAPDAMIALDDDLRIRMFNPAASTLFGWTEAEVLGQEINILVPADERQRYDEWATAFKSGEADTRAEFGLNSDTFAKRKDGSRVPILLTVGQFAHDGERIALLVGRDISEMRSLEERLRHSQKMEAIGQLTGGIAHDFNNLLTILVGHLEYMQDAYDAPGLHDAIERCMTTADRGASLTHRLLAFSRQQALLPVATDVAAALQEARDMLSRTLGEDIALQLAVGPEVWPVRIDPGQLQLALINLALNARDAMPTGGVLTLSAHNTKVPLHTRPTGEEISLDLAEGDYVVIAVTDTGTGMSQEVQTRIFEPFFTTKELGLGTGMGMSMVYGFTKQSGGDVALRSAPGDGTRVSLYLPRAEAAAATPRDRPRVLDGRNQAAEDEMLTVQRRA